VTTATATDLHGASVYAMSMYTERLQILISKEQRRRWEQEAKRQGTSVASVVREAVDDRLGGIAREERIAAVDRIAAMEPLPYISPEDLERLIDEAHTAEIERGFPLEPPG
jgi:hypothetical protein